MGLTRGALKAYISFVFSCTSFLLFSQSLVYQTGKNVVPSELIPYFGTDSLINLTHLRKVSDFLTNPNTREINGVTLPARKKAFIHYVKEISEKLELAYLLNKKLDYELVELIYQLEWMHLSYLRKAESNLSVKLSFHEKRQLFLNTMRSKQALCFSTPKCGDTLKQAIITSPFVNEADESVLPQDRFDQQAKKKKITAKAHMVVLADQYSSSGSTPKFEVFDTDLENKWVIKWGDEIHTDIFCSRLFSALGYNVDHPYYYQENLTLVFDETGRVKSPEELIDSLKIKYGISINSFIKDKGIISREMADSVVELLPYTGKPYLQFKECSLEARPNRVKRLGSFMPYALNNSSRQELQGSLLAQIYIDNWDTREENTSLTLVNQGKKQYELSPIFSDLGTSMGVHISWIHQDFKVGLVNKLSWEAIKKRRGKLHFTSSINGMVDFYKQADPSDLKWMGLKLAAIDSIGLRKMINAAHWPSAVSELYFHKMASRRASILSALNISDPHPIVFSKKINIKENGRYIVKKGRLCKAIDLADYPVSYRNLEGRMRNYGKKD